MKSTHFLSLLLFLSLTAVADEKKTKEATIFDARREDLNKTYAEKLAALRRQYEADFLALQQAETAALKARQETAMKALNLDQANQLNAEIQRVQSQTAASQSAHAFCTQHKSRRTCIFYSLSRWRMDRTRCQSPVQHGLFVSTHCGNS